MTNAHRASDVEPRRLMRVLFTSTSGHGHVQPLLSLMRAFNARGDETLLVLAEHAVASLSASGLHIVAGGEPSADAAERLWSRFSTLSRGEATPLVERDWFAGLCLQAMLPDVERVLAQWRPDLLVRETCEYAGAVAADRVGVAHVQHSVSSAAAEESVLRVYAGTSLDAHAPGLAARIFARPYLTNFPASLDPSGYPTTLRYRDEGPHVPFPLPNWWPESTAPLVYLTLGTVATRTPDGAAVLRAALDAVSDLDVRVLVATGPSLDPTSLGVTASNVHVETWVDHVDVFAQSSLVICQGGSGTTFGALAAARPLVMLPLFADQPANARRVEGAGAGIRVGGGTESAAANAAILAAHPDAIREAVVTVLSTPSYAEAAQRLADEMASAPTTRELCGRLIANV